MSRADNKRHIFITKDPIQPIAEMAAINNGNLVGLRKMDPESQSICLSTANLERGVIVQALEPLCTNVVQSVFFPNLLQTRKQKWRVHVRK